MKLYEYQAKSLIARWGILTPKGATASNLDDARTIIEKLNMPLVIKAQIIAGGRGKAGGIKTASTPEEALDAADSLLGKRLVTPQTGPDGALIKKVLIEEKQPVEKELYLSITIDYSKALPVVIASDCGGVDIEEVAQRSPERIIKEFIEAPRPVSPAGGWLFLFKARRLAYKLGLSEYQIKEFTYLVRYLGHFFSTNDCTLAEINPLAITATGKLIALDAKVIIDDNALFRHKEFESLRDPADEDPLERRAREARLNYVRLDGNIGCMINGAGLAMATLDLLNIKGGRAANFLDIGGGAELENIKEAFSLLLSDDRVKVILINIYGGIIRCNLVAEALIEVAYNIGLKIPVVIRLSGTNVIKAEKMLKESGLPFSWILTMEEAVEKVVGIVRS